MQLADIPPRFPIPFANSAGGGYIRAIPTAAVTPTPTDAPASLTEGFPPETFQPEGSGGIPPNGADFNGILNQLSAWARWVAAGVPAKYDATFATAIGGYPKFAVLSSTTPGILWQSTVENNSTNPDSGGTNWIKLSAPASGLDNVLYHSDGKVEQWGYYAQTSSGEPVAPIVLAVPYIDAAYNISLTPYISSASVLKDSWVQIISGTKAPTGFSVQYQHGGSSTSPGLDGFEWRCVGKV